MTEKAPPLHLRQYHEAVDRLLSRAEFSKMGPLQNWQNTQEKQEDCADFWRGVCAQAVGSAAELRVVYTDYP